MCIRDRVRNSNLAKTFTEDRLTKEGMENEIKRNRENAGIRTETRAIKYTGVTGINNEFERRADTVSYTHLDVYKRQEQIALNNRLVKTLDLMEKDCLLYTSRCV